MRALFDVNVVIDVLAHRAPFYDDSYAALRLVAEGRLEGYIAAGSVADMAYILHRGGLEAADIRSRLVSLTQILDVRDTTAADVANALGATVPDMEDAILAAGAKRAGADVIVTRDAQGFTASPVPALSPAQVLSRITEAGDA